jgi:hypothetical protein
MILMISEYLSLFLNVITLPLFVGPHITRSLAGPNNAITSMPNASGHYRGILKNRHPLSV